MTSIARSFAQMTFGHESFSRWLEKSAVVQKLAQWLRLRRWINRALALHPICRFHQESGVRYHIENFETLSVEKSYFGNPIYREIFAGNGPSAFIDLGCNSGMFPCLLAHLSKGQPPRGICLDASAAEVALARKTVKLNGWKDIHVFHGLVGAVNPGLDKTDFYLHPTSLGSSQFSYTESESGLAPAWQVIEVPVLNATRLWEATMGGGACDCLKIDIEGSEMNFLRQESALLEKVTAVLIEWHGWTTSRSEITNFLLAHHFTLKNTIEDTPRHGVLFFRKEDAAAAN